MHHIHVPKSNTKYKGLYVNVIFFKAPKNFISMISFKCLLGHFLR